MSSSSGSGKCPDFLLAAARVRLRRATWQADAVFNLGVDLGNLDEKDLPSPVAQAVAALVAVTMTVDKDTASYANLDTTIRTCPVFDPMLYDAAGWKVTNDATRLHIAQLFIARAALDAWYKSIHKARSNEAWQTVRLGLSLFASLRRIGFSATVQSAMDDLADAYPGDSGSDGGSGSGSGENPVKDYKDASNGVIISGEWVPDGIGVLQPLMDAIELSEKNTTKKMTDLLTGKIEQVKSIDPTYREDAVFRRMCPAKTT